MTNKLDVDSSAGSTMAMSDFKPTGELHLRTAGHTTDWTLLLVDEPLTEDEVASWMQQGVVTPIRVVEQGTHESHTLLVNFSLIVAARLVPATHGDRTVHF
jgi:hypothetical protein